MKTIVQHYGGTHTHTRTHTHTHTRARTHTHNIDDAHGAPRGGVGVDDSFVLGGGNKQLSRNATRLSTRDARARRRIPTGALISE